MESLAEGGEREERWNGEWRWRRPWCEGKRRGRVGSAASESKVKRKRGELGWKVGEGEGRKERRKERERRREGELTSEPFELNNSVRPPHESFSEFGFLAEVGGEGDHGCCTGGPKEGAEGVEEAVHLLRRNERRKKTRQIEFFEGKKEKRKSKTAHSHANVPVRSREQVGQCYP